MFLPYWTTSGQNFIQDQTIIGGIRAKKKTNKGPFHGYKKLGKFLISQPHMLYKWNLSQIYVLIRSFIWQNLGV